ALPIFQAVVVAGRRMKPREELLVAPNDESTAGEQVASVKHDAELRGEHVAGDGEENFSALEHLHGIQPDIVGRGVGSERREEVLVAAEDTAFVGEQVSVLE